MLEEQTQSFPSAAKLMPMGLLTIGSAAKRFTSKPSGTMKLARSTSGSVVIGTGPLGSARVMDADCRADIPNARIARDRRTDMDGRGRLEVINYVRKKSR